MARPAAIARRVVRRALEAAGGRPSLRDVDAVLGLAKSSQPHAHASLAGLTAERAGESVSLVRAGRPNVAFREHFCHQLTVPGATPIPETGAVIRASLLSGDVEPSYRRSAGPAVALQADRLVWPLAVRGRLPGDRFRPLGAPGARKLQDVFVDRKIACSERDLVPIVIDGTGQIVWVAGVAVADHVRATTPETGVVILEFEKGRP